MLARILICSAFLLCCPWDSSWGADELELPVEDQMTVDPADWPWWRGPFRDGHAHPDQDPPTQWSDTDNIVWKSPVPGRGHASPILVGDSIFLPTADRDRNLQSVLCFDRATGRQVWETVIHRGGLMKKNEKASQASSTMAWDGQRLFVSFLNDGAVHTTALTAPGQQLWQTKISDYIIHQGYAASPALYQDLVIVNADNKGGGAIVALRRHTGEIVWQRDRPRLPNYPSPIILNVAGKDQLLMIGCNLVTSLEPLTGRKIWEITGATEECVTSTVTDGVHIFSSGGYPDNHVSAIKADGSGQVVWRNRTRVYVPSLLFHEGYLYGVLDAGIATCWNAQTGREMWKARLGGDFSASPVLVGDMIYATNEAGETFIFRADPNRNQQVAKNQLGDDVLATPVIAGSHIYCRVAIMEGSRRQEYLCCIGE